MAKLTDKQERFCLEYMIDLNKTQAAIRAGYSESSAKEIGCENLTKPNIQDRISELKKAEADRIGLTAQEVLDELKNFAYSDITETLLLTASEVQDLPPEVRRLITQFKHTTRSYEAGEDKIIVEDVIELRFVDKMKAWEMLNRHIGFYEVDNKQNNPTDSTIHVEYNGKGLDLKS